MTWNFLQTKISLLAKVANVIIFLQETTCFRYLVVSCNLYSFKDIFNDSPTEHSCDNIFCDHNTVYKSYFWWCVQPHAGPDTFDMLFMSFDDPAQSFSISDTTTCINLSCFGGGLLFHRKRLSRCRWFEIHVFIFQHGMLYVSQQLWLSGHLFPP